MSITNNAHISKELIKFLAPRKLKRALLNLADDRNITLSALLRLVTSEYIKRQNQL